MRSLSESQRILKLSVVATPIGNLQDISFRALEVLKSVDYILCEDTRRAQKLKTHFSLPGRLVSFHEHNEEKRIPEILSRMERGKTFALISDAGTPLVSDPGYLLIREMIKRGIPFTCVPGPSAVISALVLSGFPPHPFAFFGFLPIAPSSRKEILQKLVPLENVTLILFESPQRIISLVREIGEILGDREIALCREMTKVHEEVFRGKISQLLPQLTGRKIMGEFTVVIAPGSAAPITMDEKDILARFEQLQKEGLSRKDALKKLVRESGRSRNELYKILLKK